MPSDLCVALHGGGTLLQVHALDDGIFPELLFNGQHGLLAAALPLQLLFLGGGLLLGAFGDGEKSSCSQLSFSRAASSSSTRQATRFTRRTSRRLSTMRSKSSVTASKIDRVEDVYCLKFVVPWACLGICRP